MFSFARRPKWVFTSAGRRSADEPPYGRQCLVVVVDDEFGPFYKLATYRGSYAGWRDEYGERVNPYAWFDFERAPYLAPRVA